MTTAKQIHVFLAVHENSQSQTAKETDFFLGGVGKQPRKHTFTLEDRKNSHGIIFSSRFVVAAKNMLSCLAVPFWLRRKTLTAKVNPI
jgi:hypothetical protein